MSQREPSVYVIQQKTGISKGQACLLILLAVALTSICVCVFIFTLPLWLEVPDRPLFEPTAVSNAPAPANRPDNQTRKGLVVTGVKLSPFISDTILAQPGPGNWWQVDVTFYNPTKSPITVSGYNIVLRDIEGREYWYDRNLSMFGTSGSVTPQLNPETTVVVPIVFDLPQQLDGVSLHYDGAVVGINPENIGR